MATDDDRRDDLPGRPRRAWPRYSVRRQVELRCGSWTEFLTLYTSNISRTGLLVHTSEPPEVGEEVDVRVSSPEGASVVLAGRVARVEAVAGAEGTAAVGIAVAEPDAGVLLDLLSGAHRGADPAAGVRGREEDRWKGAAASASFQDEVIPFLDPEELIEELEDDRADASEPPAGVRQMPARLTSDVVSPARSSWSGAPPVVGIDFGTTTTKVAVVLDGEVVLVEDDLVQTANRAAVPSVVGFAGDGSRLVGHAARAMLATEPARVVASVKRVLGLDFHDRRAAGFLGSIACRTEPGPEGSILFEVAGRRVTVPEVVAGLLDNARDMASRFLGTPVTRAVLTLPVEAGPRARRELELAAGMAGLDVVAMIPEPVAAAMGCGIEGASRATLAVYDFGGGTFDAAVVEVGGRTARVRGAAGDRWLGGDDLDEAIGRFVADEFHRSNGIDLHAKAEPWQRLLFACEDAKRWLSTLEEVDVILPKAATGPGGPLTLLVPVSREAFAESCRHVIGVSIEVCREALTQAGLGPEDVDAVLLTGGTSRVPAVREAVRELFDQEPIESIHPEHSVVLGAAVHAAALGRSASQRFPRGASSRLLAGGLPGRTVGLALADGTTEHIVTSDQHPPVTAHRLYGTSRDGQTSVCLEVLEGESRVSAENTRVGGFVIDGLPAAPAGVIDLNVYFELASTGALCVTAQERSTGRRVQRALHL